MVEPDIDAYASWSVAGSVVRVLVDAAAEAERARGAQSALRVGVRRAVDVGDGWRDDEVGIGQQMLEAPSARRRRPGCSAARTSSASTCSIQPAVT